MGLLADYAEVQEKYEGAIEQFLRDELEYVVVESFDQARAGFRCCAMRWAGARHSLWIRSSKLNLAAPEADASLPMPEGVLATLDRLVEFREPLGPAAKYFLRSCARHISWRVRRSPRTMARDNPHSYFLTPDGTCYHGRMVSGGRQGEAGLGVEARTTPARNRSNAAGSRCKSSKRR